MKIIKNKMRMALSTLLGAALCAFTYCHDEPAAAAAVIIIPTGSAIPAGSQGGFLQIAFVQAKRAQVTINGGASATVNGVTVSSLAVNGAGAIRAFVTADCRARDAHFTLRASVGKEVPSMATVRISVVPNSPPTLSYGATQFVAPGSSATINPDSGPTDQGGLTNITVRRVWPRFGGSITVNEQGVVAISRAPLRGTFNVTVRATDTCGAYKDASFALKVGGGTDCPIFVVNPLSLRQGAIGQHYHQNFTAGSNGAAHEFTVAAGRLPFGLRLDRNGVLEGEPLKAGIYEFSIRATDRRGCWGTSAYALTIKSGKPGKPGKPGKDLAPQTNNAEVSPEEPVKTEKAKPKKAKPEKVKQNQAALPATAPQPEKVKQDQAALPTTAPQPEKPQESAKAQPEEPVNAEKTKQKKAKPEKVKQSGEAQPAAEPEPEEPANPDAKKKKAKQTKA